MPVTVPAGFVNFKAPLRTVVLFFVPLKGVLSVSSLSVNTTLLSIKSGKSIITDVSPWLNNP